MNVLCMISAYCALFIPFQPLQSGQCRRQCQMIHGAPPTLHGAPRRSSMHSMHSMRRRMTLRVTTPLAPAAAQRAKHGSPSGTAGSVFGGHPRRLEVSGVPETPGKESPRSSGLLDTLRHRGGPGKSECEFGVVKGAQRRSWAKLRQRSVLAVLARRCLHSLKESSKQKIVPIG